MTNLIPTQRQYTNHINVKQNTQEWMDTRKGKIAGSQLPALLEIYGQEKFTNYRKIVREGLNENDVYNTQNIKNFEHRHKYEFVTSTICKDVWIFLSARWFKLWSKSR